MFFRADDDIIQRLRNALVTFGFKEEDLPFEAFTTTGNVLTFGDVPARVDLINSIDGVTFEEACPNTIRGRYGDIEVNFIGLNDLLKNKKATPRAKDKGDVEELAPEG
ncbi:MAG: hypothetical protein LAT79_11430 [Kiritimatiellae bacterium]|nr:hypothetical protein [Kiritimatiellia bacterium]